MFLQHFDANVFVGGTEADFVPYYVCSASQQSRLAFMFVACPEQDVLRDKLSYAITICRDIDADFTTPPMDDNPSDNDDTVDTTSMME